MTLLCVPIMVEDLPSALADASAAQELGAELVEYRIDSAFHGEGDEEGHALAHALSAGSPLPCIITCRTADEGGEYDGDEASRISLYESLGASDSPPRYLDLELSSWRRSANLRQKALLSVDHANQGRDLATSLVLSSHDFDGRPRDLLQRLGEMREVEAARVLKIAFRARSLRDNLELFDLLLERDRPMIALGMGAYGLMSRVLAPKFGAFLTFASLRDSSATAPGQATIEEMRELYQFDSIGAETRVYGVIGDPVSHSLSPLVHNAAFCAPGVEHDGVYLPLPVPGEWEHFKATVGALVDHAGLDFCGASVTIPHKEHLIRLAQERADEGWVVEEGALAAGAANTLARCNDGWLVTNTDAPAIRACAQAALGDDLDGKRALLLGAGGVARAAASALGGAGMRVVIAARDASKSGALCDALSECGEIESCAWDERHGQEAALVVNCTPVGMSTGPSPEASPIEIDRIESHSPEAVIFETVYSPLETPLVRSAREVGLDVIDGASLFCAQATMQSELWTGAAAPVGLFDQLARRRLASE